MASKILTRLVSEGQNFKSLGLQIWIFEDYLVHWYISRLLKLHSCHNYGLRGNGGGGAGDTN